MFCCSDKDLFERDINIQFNRCVLAKQPNILFIMADDHASKAISTYGWGINKTPNIDRIANEGIRLNHCYVTNSICTPSRAAILAGTYNHVNCVTTLNTYLVVYLIERCLMLARTSSNWLAIKLQHSR